jgi:hypothetical protein
MRITLLGREARMIRGNIRMLTREPDPYTALMDRRHGSRPRVLPTAIRETP